MLLVPINDHHFHNTAQYSGNPVNMQSLPPACRHTAVNLPSLSRDTCASSSSQARSSSSSVSCFLPEQLSSAEPPLLSPSSLCLSHTSLSPSPSSLSPSILSPSPSPSSNLDYARNLRSRSLYDHLSPLPSHVCEHSILI